MTQVSGKVWNFPSQETLQNHLSKHPATQLEYYSDFAVDERIAQCFKNRTGVSHIAVVNDIVSTLTSIRKGSHLDSPSALRFAIVTMNALEKYSTTGKPLTERAVSKL